MRELRLPDFGDGGDDLSGHRQAVDAVVSGDLVGDEPEERRQCKWGCNWLQWILGMGSHKEGLDLASQIATRYGSTGL